MGLFDILGTIGSIATGVSAIFNPQPKAAGVSTAVVAAQTPGSQAITAGGGRLTTRTIRAATDVAIATVGPQAVVSGAPSGAAAVFTQTVVQRIDRATGNVISEEVRRGSPWLMRSEVRALNRVTKMIRKADSKIKRKSAKVSDDMLRKAVREDINQLSLIQSLTHHGHHNGS